MYIPGSILKLWSVEHFLHSFGKGCVLGRFLKLYFMCNGKIPGIGRRSLALFRGGIRYGAGFIHLLNEDFLSLRQSWFLHSCSLWFYSDILDRNSNDARAIFATYFRGSDIPTRLYWYRFCFLALLIMLERTYSQQRFICVQMIQLIKQSLLG